WRRCAAVKIGMSIPFLAEGHHGARHVAGRDPGKALVDVHERQARADELVEQELALKIELHQSGELDARPGVPVATPRDLLLAQQDIEWDRHLRSRWGHAQDHHTASLTDRRECIADRLRVSDGFEGVVGAAAI